MTPREKILRDEFWKLRKHGKTMDIRIFAHEALKQADEIKDGPSEEDKKKLVTVKRFDVSIFFGGLCLGLGLGAILTHVMWMYIRG